MTNFSFTGTARCDECGNFLDSSDAACGHGSEEVKPQFFRRINDEQPHTVTIEATASWKWYALAQEVGDDWIAYEYLGPRSTVDSMLRSFDDIESIPKISLSVDGPSDVGDEVLE